MLLTTLSTFRYTFSSAFQKLIPPRWFPVNFHSRHVSRIFAESGKTRSSSVSIIVRSGTRDGAATEGIERWIDVTASVVIKPPKEAIESVIGTVGGSSVRNASRSIKTPQKWASTRQFRWAWTAGVCVPGCVGERTSEYSAKKKRERRGDRFTACV